MDFTAAEAGFPIDDLPDEIFALILNLVPIEQVVRCATVSKRWDAACRYIVRTRESLAIGYDDWYDELTGKLDWDRPSLQMDGIPFIKQNRQLIAAMMKTFNQMEELRRLCIDTYAVTPADTSPFIRKFADQLTMLEIDFKVSKIGADAFPHLTRLKCRRFDANSAAAFPKLAELVVYTLYPLDKRLPNMRLPNLKKLMIMSFERTVELVSEFILANAKNLTVMKLPNEILRLDHAVVFPNLMEVDCRFLDTTGRWPFPALTHLTVGGPVTADFLSRLPADQMLSLEVCFPRERERVVSAISKMKNLKSLKLLDGGVEEADGTLSSIFDNMHHLEKVEIESDFRRGEQGDRMIATLANQNPKLVNVIFEYIRLTNAALTSLAQLQYLTHVQITGGDAATTAGVLTLLRGASRNVIRKFLVSGKNVDEYQVNSEIGRMCEERGTTFDAPGENGVYENSHFPIL